MSQEITQHKVTDGKGKNCDLTTKVTLRKIGRILMAVQGKLINFMYQRGGWTQEEVEAAMKDSNVKQVVQKNVKSENIVLVHKESNEPIYKKEMLLIGEKGERALNESPTGEESTIVVDPDLATLYVKQNAFEEVKQEINEFIRRNSLKTN